MLNLNRIVAFTNRDSAGMNAIARKLDMAFQGEADRREYGRPT